MPQLDEMSETLGYIKAKVEKLDSLEVKVGKIETKVDRIYAWAAGAGAAATLFMYIVKAWWDKFFQKS